MLRLMNTICGTSLKARTGKILKIEGKGFQISRLTRTKVATKIQNLAFQLLKCFRKTLKSENKQHSVTFEV